MAPIAEGSEVGTAAPSPFPGTQNVTSHLANTTTEVLELQVYPHRCLL